MTSRLSLRRVLDLLLQAGAGGATAAELSAWSGVNLDRIQGLLSSLQRLQKIRLTAVSRATGNVWTTQEAQ